MTPKKVKDTKTQIVGLTDYFIEMIPSWASFVMTLACGLIAGVAGIWMLSGRFEPLVGGATGLFFIAAPAIISALLTTLASRATTHELLLRRSAYLGFFTSLVVASLFLTASAFHSRGLYTVVDSLIYAYVLLYAMRVFILSVACPYGRKQTFSLALIHPLIGLAFLLNTNALASFFPVLKIGTISGALLVLKTLVAGLVLAAGIGLFILLLNAPMKRAFGVKSFNLAKMFISHWYHGSMAIEEFLKAVGERVDTFVGVIAFRARKGLKAVLVVPYVHPGPFGTVGGSRLVQQLTQALEESARVPVIVAHGTVTHDLDPVSGESVEKTIVETRKALAEIKFSKASSPFIRETAEQVMITSQKLGDSVLMTSTFTKIGDDIDFSIGLNAMNKMRKDGETPILSDAHNCYSRRAHPMFSGDPTMFEIIDCAQKARKRLDTAKTGTLQVGVASYGFSEYSPRDGFGSEGLKVLATRTQNQTAAYIIFDANNIEPELREKIRDALSKAGFDESEVMTTDSHLVNSIRGIDNPLGARVSHQDIVDRAVETARKALEDLEPVMAGGVMRKIQGIHVLGPQKTTQLTSTVNSLVAVMKIASPVIFTATLALSLLSVLMIGW